MDRTRTGADERAIEEIRDLATPLTGPADLSRVVDAVGASRFVCLGEASHGTHEFYRWRADLSRQLIEGHGFTWIGVEGDWPDCWRINRWVRGLDEQELDASGVLSEFERWPTWMWANSEVATFLDWLHDWNLSGHPRTGSASTASTSTPCGTPSARSLRGSTSTLPRRSPRRCGRGAASSPSVRTRTATPGRPGSSPSRANRRSSTSSSRCAAGCRPSSRRTRPRSPQRRTRRSPPVPSSTTAPWSAGPGRRGTSATTTWWIPSTGSPTTSARTRRGCSGRTTRTSGTPAPRTWSGRAWSTSGSSSASGTAGRGSRSSGSPVTGGACSPGPSGGHRNRSCGCRSPGRGATRTCCTVPSAVRPSLSSPPSAWTGPARGCPVGTVTERSGSCTRRSGSSANDVPTVMGGRYDGLLWLEQTTALQALHHEPTPVEPEYETEPSGF